VKDVYSVLLNKHIPQTQLSVEPWWLTHISNTVCLRYEGECPQIV